MNELNINDFYLSKDDKLKLNDWIDSLKNNNIKKILFITGNTGCGKTKLTDLILKNYTYININNNLLNVKINEYINDCLNKNDISMMFNKNKYKGIIFDNLLSINKTIIKEIKYIIKNIHKYSKNPIIITSNDKINKNINIIRDKCICININYSTYNLNNIIDKIYDKKISIKNKNKLINKYNNNISNIIINKNEYINTNFSIIHEIDDNNKDVINLTEDLKKDINITDLFTRYSCDYNTISLNILDNIYKNYNEDNIYDIIKIYSSLCQYDIFEIYKNKNLLFNDINTSLLFSIVIPYHYIKKKNILHNNIKYNTYISKSLIYTHNNVTLYKNYNQFNYYDIIIRLLYMNKLYLVKDIFNKYECNKKILNYYIKLSNIIYNKKINNKIIKEVYKLI
jgi:hypothetical protein